MSAAGIAFDGRTFNYHRLECVREARTMIERARSAQAAGRPAAAALQLSCARSVLGHAQFWRARMHAAQVLS